MRAHVKNLIDSTPKASYIKMNEDSKIFHFMQTLITFKEDKDTRDLVLRKACYETLREDTLLTLKE